MRPSLITTFVLWALLPSSTGFVSVPSARRATSSSTALAVATRPSPQTQKEEQEYNLAVGSAIDKLRTDIPLVLVKAPDLSIFSEDIRVSDPNGERLRGKQHYSQMYRVLRGMSTIALQESSTVQARFFFDKSRSTLRSKVSVKLWLHGMKWDADPMRVDVVSTYEFDSKGVVTKHTVDRVDVDGTRTEAFQFMNADPAKLRNWLSGSQPGLLPMPATSGTLAAGEERRGAAAFTPPTTLQAEEQKFDVYGNIIPPSMQNKDGTSPSSPKMAEKKKPGFFDFLKQFEPETCEDDFDCPSNEHCCDFIVAKTCCSGGIGVSNSAPQLGLQLIPSRIDDGYGPEDGSGYPPGQGPAGGDYGGGNW